MMINPTKKTGIVISSMDDELKRLSELYKLNIVGSEAEESFDRITKLVASIFDVPVCSISLVTEDRQWFKSCVGMDIQETNREVSFCQHVVALKQTVVIEDTLKNPHFKSNRLVHELNVRFYAGAMLRTKEQNIIGTLCIIDTKPRKFTKEEQKQLEVFADLVMTQIELREIVRIQKREREEMKKEVKWAGVLQRQLLPKDFKNEHLKFNSLYIPSGSVSGDFYDYKWITSDKMFGYIVDVMGHGIPTALQTSAIRVLFSQALEQNHSLVDLVQWVNQSSIPFMPEDYYFTAFCFEFDFSTKQLTYVSAGINRFYSYHGPSNVKQHKVPGAMLGLFENASYNEHKLSIKKGDKFLFITDGFTDCLEKQKLWGKEDFEKPVENVIERINNNKNSLILRDDTTAILFEIL